MPNALITGTSSGLGQLTAERLMALEWTVTGAQRTPAAAAGEQRWETLALDLTDQASIDAAAAHVRESPGRLDALVSNAGYGLFGPLGGNDLTGTRDQFEVNLVGTMGLCRACLPLLREAGGVIVQVSSVSGQEGESLFGAYNASKFGLEGASEALAEEVEPQGIRVVIVEPGPFRTPIADKSPRWRRADRRVGTTKCGGRTTSGSTGSAPRPRTRSLPSTRSSRRRPSRARRSGSPSEPTRGSWVREHAERIIADVERAEAFLREFRGRS